MDDELRKGSVKGVVVERQVLGGRSSDVHAEMPSLCRGHERFGRIDGCDIRRPHALDQLGRERSWATADIDHALPGLYPGQVGELR